MMITFHHSLPTFCAFIVMVASAGLSAEPQALRRSDVVFMYQAEREFYEAYGATVLAWGGTPTPESLEQASDLRFFGSVGMVTEFARFYERFPERYEEALCRDLAGRPIRIPWLTDHSHKGVPYWWCCTRQPLFQIYLKERVANTLRLGADGLHIDDHHGTLATHWHGGCFCDRCVDEFRVHLAGLTVVKQTQYEVEQPENFDFQTILRTWKNKPENQERPISEHPLWYEWQVYQSRGAAAFMAEIRAAAEDAAGGRVFMGANAGLLWPGHLSDYQVLDLFSAETDHHAERRAFYDGPILAYRLADAFGRPYASTAGGQDWAFIKEHELSGLVRGWVALSYASGHALMAPHYQWCYTKEKGTHWYNGPEEAYAPLYQFVRHNAHWLDGYSNRPDIGLVVPHAALFEDVGGWVDICSRLSEAQISFTVLLAGDRLVDSHLTEAEWNACPAWLVLELDKLQPVDRAFVEDRLSRPGVYRSVEAVLENVLPAVRVKAPASVRVFPRLGPTATVVHLVNYDYDAAEDEVRPQSNLTIELAPGVRAGLSSRAVQLRRPDGDDLNLEIEEGRISLPELGLWAMLRLEHQPAR